MLLLARAALIRHEPEVRGDLVRALEARDVVEGGDEPERRHRPDHRHRLYAPSQPASHNARASRLSVFTRRERVAYIGAKPGSATITS